MLGRPSESGRYQARTRPVVPPIYQSATFFLDEESYRDIESGGLEEHWYSRFRNPTVDVVADAVAALEQAEAGLMTSSGMAAIATTLLTLVGAGDRVVASRQVYGDTRDLLVRDLPRLGVEVVLVDAADLPAWRAAVEQRPAAVVYTETLSNPQLEVADLPALAALASAAGAVVGDRATVREIQRRVVTFGGCLDPHAAYLVWRGLQTFELRLRRECATARVLAAYLESRGDVVSVRYPGLPSHPGRSVVSRVMKHDRGGAMVAFAVTGGDSRALQVMQRLRLACEATSLGGVESLVSTPFNSSHFSLTPEERHAARIDDGMIRLSCGLEEPDDLIADLRDALDNTPTRAVN